VQKKFQKELKGFECRKGTIKFTPRKPLPVALVKALVKARIAENKGAKLNPSGTHARKTKN